MLQHQGFLEIFNKMILNKWSHVWYVYDFLGLKKPKYMSSFLVQNLFCLFIYMILFNIEYNDKQ